MKKIAIVGGGIAGSSIALYLGELGLDVTLFEKNESLVDGPPICHLHAGGNLYREISDAQCIRLLKESIELVQLYPCAVDFRPTVIAVPINDKGEPKDLFSRLFMLQKEYERVIEKDVTARVLGKPEEYFKLYEKSDIEALRLKKIVDNPVSFDEWMIPVVQNVNLSKVKFPLIMVQEYGLNVFRLGANVTLSLKSVSNVEVFTQTEVKDIQKISDTFEIKYEKNRKIESMAFDYLINAAGFKSGEIDDILKISRERYVEFKAAYVTKWKSTFTWPEIIFYGERGTPQGMAQFTPYADGYFQLHGMTEDITLFEDGLVKSHSLSAQPQLAKKYIQKIYSGWRVEDVTKRSQRAIDHLAQYIPAFKDAQITAKPLFGAQQIPGNDASLRAAEVSFWGNNYARCEIVKASSVLSMADAITKQLIALHFLDEKFYGKRYFHNKKRFTEEELTHLAQELCESRNYPISLALRNNSSLIL